MDVDAGVKDSKELQSEIQRDATDGSHLLEALPESTQRLQQYIEKNDWEGAEKEIKVRDQLLGDLSRSLGRHDPDPHDDVSLKNRRRIRWVLEDMQTTNEQFLAILKGRVSYLKEKLKGIRKGRKTLGLYRIPHQAEPRFYNRFG